MFAKHRVTTDADFRFFMRTLSDVMQDHIQHREEKRRGDDPGEAVEAFAEVDRRGA